jgi:hypothetical protein
MGDYNPIAGLVAIFRGNTEEELLADVIFLGNPPDDFYGMNSNDFIAQIHLRGCSIKFSTIWPRQPGEEKDSQTIGDVLRIRFEELRERISGKR